MAQNETMMTAVCDVFTGPMKNWAWLATLLMLVFTVIFFYALHKFVTIHDDGARAFWGPPMVLAALFVAMLKIWFWLEMLKNSIIKALKK